MNGAHRRAALVMHAGSIGLLANADAQDGPQ